MLIKCVMNNLKASSLLIICESCNHCFYTAIDCGELQAPMNGQVTLTGTVFNSLAVYSCNPGFTLVGSAARTCMASGQWSGEAPTCVCECFC